MSITNVKNILSGKTKAAGAPTEREKVVGAKHEKGVGKSGEDRTEKEASKENENVASEKGQCIDDTYVGWFDDMSGSDQERCRVLCIVDAPARNVRVNGCTEDDPHAPIAKSFTQIAKFHQQQRLRSNECFSIDSSRTAP